MTRSFFDEMQNPTRWIEDETSGRPKAVGKVRTNSEPLIANSATAVKVEARMRERLGPMKNVKGDRPEEIAA